MIKAAYIGFELNYVSLHMNNSLRIQSTMKLIYVKQPTYEKSTDNMKSLQNEIYICKVVVYIEKYI